MIVDELVAILGYEMRGQDKLRAFTQSIDDAARRLASFAVAAAAAAAAGAALLGKSVIETTAQFESFQATLETVEGSAEKARAAMDWVSKFASKTPYEVEELTRAFVKLRAYGMDPTNGLMEDLGNASSAMGKSLIDAVEMIADASTGEFERLKEFGIRAEQQGKKVTFSWTENGKTLTKTVNKTSSDITKFIQERFGSRFSGAMERQSKTWNGMMSNLGDSWTDFQRRIGEAGFFEAAKNQLGRVLQMISRLDADGSLDRWARNISSAFTWATETIGNFALRIGRHIGTIADIINNNKGAWDWLKWVLVGLAVRLFPIASLFGAIALALDDWLTYMRGGKSVIGDFLQSLEGFAGVDSGKISEIVGTLGGMAGLAVAAGGVALFAMSLSPLTKALLAFAAAFAAAKAGLDFLSSQDIMNDKKKATDNPRSKPGYIESGGYDKDGKPIYMDGNRRVDRPDEYPTAGFTLETSDFKYYLQNLEGNLAKQDGGRNAAAATQDVNDNRQDNRNQSVSVGGVNVVVNGVAGASAAVGGQLGSAIGNAAARAGGTRFEKDDQL